jgi:hypothetical protein
VGLRLGLVGLTEFCKTIRFLALLLIKTETKSLMKTANFTTTLGQ